jgi:hypothetical protein
VGIPADLVSGRSVPILLGECRQHRRRREDTRIVATNVHSSLGASAGNGFKTNVDVSKGSFNGSLDWGYQGIMVFVTGAF